MRFGLVVAAGLLFACAAQAQNSHQIIANAGGRAGGGFGGGAWGGGSLNTESVGPVVYEEPRQFAVGYATLDGPFVPSTYMSYEDALALGKQMLAEEEEAKAGRGPKSVAGAARINRAAKVSTSAPRLRVSQDDAGKLQVCDSNGNDCHRP